MQSWVRESARGKVLGRSESGDELRMIVVEPFDEKVGSGRGPEGCEMRFPSM